mmetsp:Transcript_37263/g.110039  ORF Transcript_37263/g.110039 Transcript_37263/m.110039 type:complete len:304 (+) Transcript_37263:709-1620(+)
MKLPDKVRAGELAHEALATLHPAEDGYESDLVWDSNGAAYVSATPRGRAPPLPRVAAASSEDDEAGVDNTPQIDEHGHGSGGQRSRRQRSLTRTQGRSQPRARNQAGIQAYLQPRQLSFGQAPHGTAGPSRVSPPAAVQTSSGRAPIVIDLSAQEPNVVVQPVTAHGTSASGLPRAVYVCTKEQSTQAGSSVVKDAGTQTELATGPTPAAQDSADVVDAQPYPQIRSEQALPQPSAGAPSSSHGAARPALMCDCGLPALGVQAATPDARHRVFYKCPRSECEFFSMLTIPRVPDPFSARPAAA